MPALRRFEVAETSMAPAFHPGDLLVAVRPSIPARGVPVVFEHPRRPGFWMLKRVVGLPGELVEISGGSVLVDGTGLDEPWAVGATGPPASVRVPDDGVFVLSDARERTLADSRTLGPVPLSSTFRVLFVYWPPRRVGRVIPAAGRRDP